MDNTDNKQTSYAFHVFSWAKYVAHVFQDISKGLLGFIPNGLNAIYDHILKAIPGIGKLFAHRWIEQVLKLISGITIGQGLAVDVARYAGGSLGFILGAFIGTFAASYYKKLPEQHDHISQWLNGLSGFTLGGALLGTLVLNIICQFTDVIPYTVNTLVVALGLGAVLGLLIKMSVLIAIRFVQTTHAATWRSNVEHAKGLNDKLKKQARLKAKSRILIYAQDIIQQMNGAQSQQNLENFFKDEYQIISESPNKKIDRHFNYLADRACHGDEQSLQRLQDLASRNSTRQGEKTPLDLILDRIFNARAIFKLKDDVDTAYDRWFYHFLRKKNLPVT